MVNAGLPCPSLSDTTLTGDAGFDEQGAVGVADVVGTDLGDPGCGHDPVEGLRDGMGVGGSHFSGYLERSVERLGCPIRR